MNALMEANHLFLLRLYEESKELINNEVDQFDFRDVEILSYQRSLIR